MKVGDFVRNKYGIAKVIDIENNNGIDILVFDNPICFLVNKETGEIKDDRLLNKLAIIDNIDISKIKSSPRIIDLVQVGDYVNGFRVKDVYKPEGTYVLWLTLSCNPIDRWKNEDIKSIVTKEQFSAMEYKVESEVK